MSFKEAFVDSVLSKIDDLSILQRIKRKCTIIECGHKDNNHQCENFDIVFCQRYLLLSRTAWRKCYFCKKHICSSHQGVVFVKGLYYERTCKNCFDCIAEKDNESDYICSCCKKNITFLFPNNDQCMREIIMHDRDTNKMECRKCNIIYD